jgi:hypothetical protein
MDKRVPTSNVLEDLLKAAPPGPVTLEWIMARLSERSFGIVILLIATLFAPIPFSQLIPAAVTALLAFAFLEEDGILLAVALGAAVLSLGITAITAWGTIEASLALSPGNGV